MIPPETISLVRDRTDMVAVVQESVPSLKRRGRSWSGLCPFHKEKSPSFHVNPERGFFKCFGCGEGGDVFTFVMREFGYTFHEAVRMLAERIGIEIQEEQRERTDVDRARKQKDDVYAANALAATWFEEQLRKHPLRGMALDELARRGIVPSWASDSARSSAEGARDRSHQQSTDEALQAFRIGYAPDGWDGLATFFRQQGISPQVGELAGLIGQRASGSGHYDRFRHRLMFSVLDVQGRVVAFSGRALADPPQRPGGAPPRDADQKVAKYINSTETPVYKKGNVLFGLFQARHAIREKQVAVVVEGNFDVFSLHARGLANVVAPLGTAFTPEQALLLKRYAPTAVLLFDGDAAGRAAVKKSRAACMEAELVAKVAALPDGMDPDDFARTRGIGPLEDVLTGAKGLLEFLIDAELDGSFAAADVREKLARVDAVAELIASEPDPLVRMMAKGYADMVSGRVDIHGQDAFRALEQKIRAAARRIVVQGPDRSHSTSSRPDLRNGVSTALHPRGPENRPTPSQRMPKTAGSAERRAIVGVLLEYPSLLDDTEVERVCALLEGPAALTVATLRRFWATSVPARNEATEEKRLDTAGFLAQIPQAIQAFAAERFAAPEHESEGKAKEALLENAQKLERLLLEHEVVAIRREMETSNDGADDLERLRRAQDLRAAAVGGRVGGNADAARTSPTRAASGMRTGATPDEERQTSPEERDRVGGDEDAGREEQWRERPESEQDFDD